MIKEANDKIIIIDNYIDKSILDMLVYKKNNVKVELVTSSHYLIKLDINKFNKQYHIGASLKDLGKKYFGINRIKDKEYLDKILSKIK